MMYLTLIPLALLSGILGRCGGSENYDTKYRDIGCSIIVVIATGILLGFHSNYWYVYLLIFGLHWGAFSTYWDFIFKHDNLWFSGFMVGLAIAPILYIDHTLWWFVVARSLGLAAVWGILNKYLPAYFFKLRRDVAEEFLRYTASF